MPPAKKHGAKAFQIEPAEHYYQPWTMAWVGMCVRMWWFWIVRRCHPYFMRTNLSVLAKPLGLLFGGWTLKACDVRVADNLNTKDLLDLLEGRILALHVPGFVDPETSAQVTEWILAKKEKASLEILQGKESDVTLGFGLSRRMARNEAAVRRYFDTAVSEMRVLRNQCLEWGMMNPIDKLRLELDECYPDGCVVDQERGRKLFAGLSRVNYANAKSKDGRLHIDSFPITSPDVGLFSANIYLQQCDEGGALHMWPVNLPSAATLTPPSPRCACSTTAARTASSVSWREPVPVSSSSSSTCGPTRSRFSRNISDWNQRRRDRCGDGWSRVAVW